MSFKDRLGLGFSAGLFGLIGCVGVSDWDKGVIGAEIGDERVYPPTLSSFKGSFWVEQIPLVEYSGEDFFGIKDFVEDNLEGIMYKQEVEMGIRHFGVPEIFYGMPQGREEDSFATYRLLEDKICLNISAIEKGFVKLLKNPKRTNFLFIEEYVGMVLDHELGHYYSDKFSESLGLGSWPPLHFEENQKIGRKIIMEGIAEYFRIHMNVSSGNYCSIGGVKGNFTDTEWSDNVSQMRNSRHYYEGGHHLVKPIIDVHGRRGIETLIRNVLLEDSELRDMVGFRERIMTELEATE